MRTVVIPIETAYLEGGAIPDDYSGMHETSVNLRQQASTSKVITVGSVAEADGDNE